MSILRLILMVLVAVAFKLFANTLGLETDSVVNDGIILHMMEVQVFQIFMGLLIGIGILGIMGGLKVKRSALFFCLLLVVALPWIGLFVDPYVAPTYDLAMRLLHQSLGISGFTGGLLLAGLLHR